MAHARAGSSAMTSDASFVVRKLESIFTLSHDEKKALEGLPVEVAKIGRDQDVVQAGDHPSRSFFLQEGVACSYKITGEGSRQILNFHVPGDIPDLQGLHLEVLDFSVTTITGC